jgi:hypothetical protein
MTAHPLGDWRCECGDLNGYHESFCYRCGAGQPDVLTDHQNEYAYHLEQANEARENRDRAILAALTEGYTHTQIAEATGLTRGRIGQIANRKDTP